MRLMIDTSKVSFQVSSNPVAKLDQQGRQRTEKDTGVPMWSVELVALDAKGAQVLTVTVTNPVMPAVTVGQAVVPLDLEALPWMNKDRDGNPRHGTAFKATELKVPAGVGK